MLIERDAIQTPTGQVIYRDDHDPDRLYVLPSAVELKRRADSSAEFTLLFYQEDFPQRGARLVASFAIAYPQIAPETLASLAGADARIDGVNFTGGEINMAWEGFDSPPCVIDDLAHGGFHSEISLTREQAKLLRQMLRGDAETVRVNANLSYEVTHDPLPARGWIDLRTAHKAIKDTVGGGELTGARLRLLLLSLSPAAVRIESTDRVSPGDISVNEELASIMAPIIVHRIASIQTPIAIFDTTRLTLLPEDQVPDGKMMVDFSQSSGWQRTWQASWSLSAFYQEISGTAQAAKYFPQVLALPPVGNVEVFIENLLPVDGECIDKVMVKVRYRRLGSLEESVFETQFDTQTSPVARCTVQRIAMMEFSYRYQVQVRLAQEDASQPGVRIFPQTAQWITAAEPIVRIGFDAFPFALAHVRAQPEIFAQVNRVDIEIAPVGADQPQAVRSTTLSATHLSRWMTLEPRLFSSGTLRWRAILHADDSAEGPSVIGPWQVEGSLAATVTLAHVYPREPLRIRAKASFANLDEVTGVKCEFISGKLAQLVEASLPDLSCYLVSDQALDLVLWPKSIFEQGYSSRYGIEIAGTELEWTPWRFYTESDIEMKIEDDFYATRTIQATLKAPWSQRNGPDPQSHDADFIFVELHLRIQQATGVQSSSHTFDKTNVGTAVRWKIKSRKGQNRVQFEILALCSDGRMLNFGPFETDNDQLAIEIYRERISDSQPAEFGIRWSF